MSRSSNVHGPEHGEQVMLYVLQALPACEKSALEAHFAECSECREQIDLLRPGVDSSLAGPSAVLCPTAPLWERLARRVAGETSKAPPTWFDDESLWKEPQWREVAPGLSYQLLSEDRDTRRLAMLVQLGRGVEYPSHVHAGVEELYLLDGELWIDDRKLLPGDYNRAEAGTGDKRVWSETGCTCVLMTSAEDILK